MHSSEVFPESTSPLLSNATKSIIPVSLSMSINYTLKLYPNIILILCSLLLCILRVYVFLLFYNVSGAALIDNSYSTFSRTAISAFSLIGPAHIC